MSARRAAAARAGAGAAVLAGVLWVVGPEPFVAGVRSLTVGSVAVAVLLTGVATVACGWRWCRVAGGLGVALPLPAAVRGCYRAQLLNLLLPGGVLGDLHRGLRHGRDTGRTTRALGSVATERIAGQAVQVVVLLVVLVVLPGPLAPAPAYAALGGLAVVAAALVLGGRRLRAQLVPVPWPAVVVGSVVALAAHVATIVVAARTVGVALPVAELVPLALVVLTVAALPLSLAGWGPREGAAVAVFAAAGPGAAAGAAVAAAYGLLVLAAHLPALGLLAGGAPAATPVRTPAVGEVA